MPAPHTKCTVIMYCQVYCVIVLTSCLLLLYLVFKKDVLFMSGTEKKKPFFLSLSAEADQHAHLRQPVVRQS